MTAVRANAAATIGLALVTTAVVLVPLTLLGLWFASTPSGAAGLDPTFDPSADGSGDPSGFAATFMGGGVIASFAPGLAVYVTALLLPLFMAVVVGQGVQGRRIGLGDTARAARGRILQALGVVLLVGLAAVVLGALLVGGVAVAWATSGRGDGSAAAFVTFVAVVVGVVAFVLFSVRWAFAVTIVVLEGAGPVRALRRSWQLTRKRGFWRILGIRLLTAIVVGIVGSVLTAPVGLVVGVIAGASITSAAWMFVLLQAVSVLVQSVLTTPFSSGVDSLLYVDQRIRYEGLDLALLQTQQGHDAPMT
ncbi:glycerophosphoryl diester phosphodiesterase membrane domain-containing protein [Terrabacter sp. BE26]|uniref:glycerophosphoryl diester phosphodiesterase membrane domain-containing protein n=1 Tax=Terrabacter sp. BE26 TaxID=2898152 RepID=UPI0035BE324C